VERGRGAGGQHAQKLGTGDLGRGWIVEGWSEVGWARAARTAEHAGFSRYHAHIHMHGGWVQLSRGQSSSLPGLGVPSPPYCGMSRCRNHEPVAADRSLSAAQTLNLHLLKPSVNERSSRC
jgi:hypothetical protein